MARLDIRAVSSFQRSILRPADVSTSAFNAKATPGIFSEHSIPKAYHYTPLTLDPTPTFYHVLNQELKHSNFTVPGKFPAHFTVAGIGEVRVNVVCRLYVPSFIAIQLRLEVEDIDLSSDAIFQVREVHNFEPFRTILRTATSLAGSEDHRTPVRAIETKIFNALELEPGAEIGPDEPLFNHKRAAGLLINNASYESMTDSIVKSISTLSESLNQKDTRQLLLANKQGLLLISPHRGDRFKKSVDLAEIAQVMQAFLRQYPTALRAPGQEEFCDFIFGIIQSWVHHPDVIFAASVSNEKLWDRLSSDFKLPKMVDLIDRNCPWLEEELANEAKYLSSLAESWATQPEFARTFAANISNQSGRRLTTITDPIERDELLSDIGEAHRALASKSYKAAMVMAGSSVEALLLSTLEVRLNAPPSGIRNLGLHQLVELAEANPAEARIDPSLLNAIDGTLRPWRNLVHRGRQLRDGTMVSASKAELSINVLDALVGDIDK